MDEPSSELIIEINNELDCSKSLNPGQLKTELNIDPSFENDISKNSEKNAIIINTNKEEKKTTKNTSNKKITPLEKEKKNILLNKKRKLDSSIEKKSTQKNENENNENMFVSKKENIYSLRIKLKEKAIINNNIYKDGLKFTNNFHLFTFSNQSFNIAKKKHLYEPKLYFQNFVNNPFRVDFYERERINEQILNNLYYIK